MGCAADEISGRGVMTQARSLFEKIWARHVILEREDGAALLYVGRHLVHDGTAAAFVSLAERGLKPRRPDRIFGTPDHYVPTTSRDVASVTDAGRRHMIESLEASAKTLGFTAFGLGDRRQGIIHVIGPEQGISQPGMVMVCGDSHTASHGAVGALAFGIGSSEVAHVLATQTLWQAKPRCMRVTVTGALAPGVTAKDLILAIIAQIGAGGGTGHVIEYAGPAIAALSIEARLTLCNMSIEAGARAGMVAPDEVTFDYLKGRPFAPAGGDWERAVAYWRTLPTDEGAVFDREVTLDGAGVAPMVTWGLSPETALPITGAVPDPADEPDAERRAEIVHALDYMGLRPGMKLAEIAVDRVFIGSCTNSRIEDLRAAAAVIQGRRTRIPAIVVPGSGLVKAQAEAEGLDGIFLAAGMEWRHAGCSLCVGMNGDVVAPRERCASTSNRNFAGRQGRLARTHLVSPAMAAAAALTGHFTDVRRLLEET
jgi:3-isopropylmalate/(R)-2-methylmalate dehydratase large subunit